MVILSFWFTARSQHVQFISMPQQSDWHCHIKCSNCNQQFPKQITFNKFDQIQMTKQHGTAHFGASCKNCQRKCYIIINNMSKYKVEPNEDGVVKGSLAIVQCRGCEILKVNVGNSLSVKVANSTTVFQNADFTDLWCEVDEQTDLLAQVEDPIIQVVPHK